MTPLIEFTPAPFLPRTNDKGTIDDASDSKPLLEADLTPDPGSVLRRQAKEVLRFWGNSPFFLDLGHLEGKVPLIDGGTHALTYFADLARSYRLKPVPVTTLNRPATYRAAAASIVKLDRNGLCIRVNVSELDDEMFARRLAEAIDEYGANLPESDLVLDYGVDQFGDQLLGLVHRKPRRAGFLQNLPRLGCSLLERKADRPLQFQFCRFLGAVPVEIRLYLGEQVLEGRELHQLQNEVGVSLLQPRHSATFATFSILLDTPSSTTTTSTVRKIRAQKAMPRVWLLVDFGKPVIQAIQRSLGSLDLNSRTRKITIPNRGSRYMTQSATAAWVVNLV